MPAAEEPSSERLLDLLRQAREYIVESRRYQEVLALLDAMIRDTEIAARSWARDRRE